MRHGKKLEIIRDMVEKKDIEIIRDYDYKLEIIRDMVTNLKL